MKKGVRTLYSTKIFTCFMNTLDELFSSIDKELRRGKKLKDLGPVLSSYSGDDWRKFERYNSAHYSRNLVKINDQIEMLVLCWDISQGCPVHDHPVNGCLVRIMQNEVTENVYEFTDKPELISSSILPEGGIAFKEGRVILHEIFNHSGKRAASIHIYSPPQYSPNYYFADKV